MQGYVYVLEPNLTIGEQRIVKIGYTTRSVAQRVRQLQTSSPVAFSVAYSIHVENAKALERQLHNQFSHCRIRAGGGTEYFAAHPNEVIQAIEKIAASVSRRRAQSALAAELSRYEEEVGAAKVRAEISKQTGRVGWCSVAVIGWLLYSFDGFYAFLAFCVGSWAAMEVYGRFHAHLMATLFSPRFESLIESKREELLTKYPLARTAAA
jgi:T5orf172 domain